MLLTSNQILKIDDSLGVVLGWGIISKIDGQEYFDKQDHHIPEQTIFESAVDFVLNSGVHKEMHKGSEKGQVVFVWPMTTEIAKAFDIQTKVTGLMIGVKPNDPAILEKFKDGTYTGFSIGGVIVEDQEVTE